MGLSLFPLQCLLIGTGRCDVVLLGAFSTTFVCFCLLQPETVLRPFPYLTNISRTPYHLVRHIILGYPQNPHPPFPVANPLAS